MPSKALKVTLAILIAVGLFYFGYSYNPNLKNTSYTASQSNLTVSMMIDDGKAITGFTNQTIPADDPAVFGLLKQVTTTNNITLDYTPAAETSFNAVFVKQVGDKKNGQNNAYWQYWVGGVQPQVGADKYNLTGGETVLWTFRPSAM